MRIQEVICQELNLPGVNPTVPGASQPPFPAAATAGGLDGQIAVSGGAQPPDSAASNNALYHFREMQRRVVEFVKKRVLLLEKGLNAEYQKEYFVSRLYIFYFYICLFCLCKCYLTIIKEN